MNIPMIALGDSIMWGQGLPEANKFKTHVRNRLATYLRGQGIDVSLYSYAHSGAEIRPEEGDSREPLWGEVPTAAPSIQRQLSTAVRHLGTLAQQPCLVLVDGGINDISLTNIFTIDPTIWDKPAWIAKITQQAVGPRMQELLDQILTAFPHAYVIVTGYYQIISPNSLSSATEAAMGRFLSGLFPGVPLVMPALLPQFPSQCAAFANAANAGLASAVANTNTAQGEERVFFALPPFGAANALGAEAPYLWLGSDDPLAAERQGWYLTHPFDGPIYTPVASIGHPNVQGARVYANAVNRQLARMVRQIAPFRTPISRFGPNESWTDQAYYGSRGTYFADLTGDGTSDAIAVNDDGIYVRLSNGTQFVGPAQNWTGSAFHDLSGRGTYFADVNGDGMADAIVVNDDGVYVRLSTGSSFGPMRKWTDSAFYGSRGTYFADLTGDGMADAIAVNDDGVYVRRSNGTRFVGPAQNWSGGAFFDLTGRGMYFADVNGDGRADAIVVNDDGVHVRLSNGAGLAPAQNWTSGAFYGSRGTFFADVDGDGLVDAIAVNDGGVTIRRSTSGRFLGNENWSGGPYYGSVGSPVYFADVTGDGCADALVINADRVTVRRAAS